MTKEYYSELFAEVNLEPDDSADTPQLIKFFDGIKKYVFDITLNCGAGHPIIIDPVWRLDPRARGPCSKKYVGHCEDLDDELKKEFMEDKNGRHNQSIYPFEHPAWVVEKRGKLNIQKGEQIKFL